MNLKELVFSIQPRENSGSIATNRFDFQRDWAICKLLELHATGSDYLLAIEFHDDVAVFDSSSDPQKVCFYQIKTRSEKEGNWLLTDLVRQKTGKKGPLGSFLGKMYGHISNFGAMVESLHFVTNVRIKGTLASKVNCEDIDDFRCSDLENKQLAKILKSLEKELGLSSLANFDNITFFKLNELHVDKHADLAKAKLLDFIEKTFPGASYQVTPMYKAIFDELKNKSDVEAKLTDFESLKKRKAISRHEFESYISLAGVPNRVRELAKDIEQRLNTEQVPARFVLAFRKYAKQFEVELMDKTNKTLKAVVEKSKEVVQRNAVDSSLYNMLDNLLLEAKPALSHLTPLEDDYLKTIILFQVFESNG